MNKVIKGDLVKVISGSDKGKTGHVLAVDPTAGAVKVSGVSVAKRHKRGTERGSGEILEQEKFIPVSKVMVLVDDKPAKVGFSLSKNAGKKERVLTKRR